MSMAEQLFNLEQLSESEKQSFRESDENRSFLLQMAKASLDKEGFEDWLQNKIQECQNIIKRAFLIIEARYSSEIIELDPLSPVDYCIAHKWIGIYKSLLDNPTIPHKKDISFDEYINVVDYERKSRIKAKLHDLIDGKQGKWIALVIRCCINCGLITKPKYSDLIAEFGNVIGESNYKKYLSEFTVPHQMVANEINAIEKQLSEFA